MLFGLRIYLRKLLRVRVKTRKVYKNSKAKICTKGATAVTSDEDLDFLVRCRIVVPLAGDPAPAPPNPTNFTASTPSP
jgi:hypothetical protein